MSISFLGRGAYVITLVVMAGLLFIPARAQTPPVPDALSVLPKVYADDLKVTVSDTNMVTGTFTLENGEAAGVGDISYEILLLSPAPAAIPGQLISDNAIAYDRAPQSGALALKPNEKKTISFNYHALSVPAGDYRIRVQVRLSNDRELGWATTPLRLPRHANKFAIIEPQLVKVNSIDPITNEQRGEWAPKEGVNVDAGQILTLEALAGNVGTEALTATAYVTVKRILVNSSQVIASGGPTITIPPQQQQTLSVPLTAVTEPGAYSIWVTLRDENNQRISSIGEYRYVVRGVSGSIVSAYLEKMTVDTATIGYTIVGPSDRQTQSSASLVVTLLDNTTEIATATQEVNLSQEGTTQKIQLTLSQVPQNPQLRLQLRGHQGQVLHTYNAIVPAVAVTGSAQAKREEPPPAAPNTSLLAVAAGGTVLLAALVGTFLFYRHTRRRVLPPALLPIVLLAASAIGVNYFYGKLTASQSSASASGFGVQQVMENNNGSFSLAVFVNLPRHNRTYTSYDVPYEVSLRWLACDNAWYTANMNIFGADDHVSSSILDPLPSFISEHLDSRNWLPVATFGSGQPRTINAGPYSTTLNVTPPANDRKTILTVVDALKSNTPPGGVQGPGTRRSRTLYGDFTWINFNIAAAPTPSPSVAPTTLSCTPAFQGATPNQGITFTPIDPTNTRQSFYWTARGGIPALDITTDTSPDFITRFRVPGSYQVELSTARFAPPVSTCNVNIGIAPLSCNVSAGPHEVDDLINFTAVGGDTPDFTWLAPSGSTSNSSGRALRLFAISFAVSGRHTVTVINGPQVATCTVTVQPSSSGPQPSASPSPVPSLSPSAAPSSAPSSAPSTPPSPAPGPSPTPASTFNLGGFRYSD